MSFPKQNKVQEALMCLLFFNESRGDTKSSYTYKPLADFFELAEQERKIPRKFKDARYEPKWNNIVQFARRKLVAEGLIEKNSKHGIWKLTSKGREYAHFLEKNYLALKPFQLEPKDVIDKDTDELTLPDLEDIDFTLSPDPFDETAKEGKRKLISHFRRERNPRIVKLKKANVLKTSGRLQCEICEFDFNDEYGNLGYGFCEAHHTKPLSQAEDSVETNIDDLAILCSNCHRMIHRTKPMKSVADFRKQMNEKSL